MPTEPQRRERQMTFWDSAGRIVPLKPVVQTGGSKRGNARAGKAAKLTRETIRPLTAPKGGSPVLARLHRIIYRAERDATATFNNLYTLLTEPTVVVWQTLCAKLQGHFQYYNINDNWRWVVKFREAARRMGLRWMRHRSQNSRVTWESYNTYLRQHPLPNPNRITDLIAKARQMADNALPRSQTLWLFEN